MRIGLAQINVTLGDFAGNRIKILEATRRSKADGCDLLVFPELTLMGYLPNDLLERESVIEDQLREFEKIRAALPDGISILVGLVTPASAGARTRKGKPYRNSAALLKKGAKPRFFHKELLPTYDVFDEARHMERGSMVQNFFTFKGRRFFLTICEDIWGWELPDRPGNYGANPLLALKGEKVDLVLNMSASPFTTEKAKDRLAVVSRTAKNFKAPMVYVNLVGAQDEIIFDGASFAVNARGQIMAQSAFCREDLNYFDLDERREKRPVSKAKVKTSAVALDESLSRREPIPVDPSERIRGALVLGIRDYVHKTGFQKVHLGLSGGIDSAVVACLAADAVGPENVVVVTLPGPFNEARSKSLAEKMARGLKLRCLNLPIARGYEALLATLDENLGSSEFGLVNENLQARLRGVLLMALSNKENSILLTTGNKSEYATGYSTLYGDMCGGLAPIADLLKGQVYALARLYNRTHEIIPDEIITRAPSAELRPNQKDQDSLPPYDDLDESVRRLVERSEPAKTKTDRWLMPILARTEFKRWQAPPILKVSGHAFGRGRRVPIAHKSRV